MGIVSFAFDKEKDIWNFHRIANWNDCGWQDVKKTFSPKIFEIAEGKSLEQASPLIEEFNKRVYNSPMLAIQVSAVNQAWQSIELEFFKRLEKVMEKPNAFPKITGYITTMQSCPYNMAPNDTWFMFKFFGSTANATKTAAHEIMHFQFHNYYWREIAEKIGQENTGHLKEALTVLLNLEFNDLVLDYDYGYPVHKNLRKFITEQWQSNPSFNALLESCIQYFGENEIPKPTQL
ncbi:MAG: hypothetical protein Q7R70_05480 [Candidatus Diapherotrites archaeon]|nr:hypothetical protein [Candidatus Diapherotrites archaeon]